MHNRRLLFILAAMAGLTAAMWAATAFAAGPQWVRSYPERRADGCDWVVASWNDSSFTSVPWNCPAGLVAQRAGSSVTATRSYPQLESGNCVWYVVLWNDGVYTKVPFTCPAGITLDKDGTTRGTPQPTPVPAAPTPTPGPSVLFPTANVTGTNPNCGVTNFVGKVTDASGNGLSGFGVRVSTSDGTFTTVSNLSDGNGDWSVVVAPFANPGTWQIWVDVNGQRASSIVNARTDGTDKCAAGSGGVQTVTMTFSQAASSGSTPAPAPAPTVAPSAPTPTPASNAGLAYTQAIVTGTNPNCGVTDIRGTLLDASGNGVAGTGIRVTTTDGLFTTVSNLTDSGGNWDVVLDTQAKAGNWQVWVDVNGQRASPIINVRTDGADRCAAGSGGVQSVRIQFRR